MGIYAHIEFILVYLPVYVYTHIYIYTPIYVYTHTHKCVQRQAHRYVRTHTHGDTCLPIHIRSVRVYKLLLPQLALLTDRSSPGRAGQPQPQPRPCPPQHRARCGHRGEPEPRSSPAAPGRDGGRWGWRARRLLSPREAALLGSPVPGGCVPPPQGSSAKSGGV